MGKPTWEYLTIALGADSPSGSEESALNAYGKQGWEAIGLATLADGQTAVLMKKPLPKPRLGGSRIRM